MYFLLLRRGISGASHASFLPFGAVMFQAAAHIFPFLSVSRCSIYGGVSGGSIFHIAQDLDFVAGRRFRTNMCLQKDATRILYAIVDKAGACKEYRRTY